jgi:hypothetical protein
MKKLKPDDIHSPNHRRCEREFSTIATPRSMLRQSGSGWVERSEAHCVSRPVMGFAFG